MSWPLRTIVPCASHQAAQALDQRRLAGAVGAHDGDHLAGADVHVDAATMSTPGT